MKYSVDDSQASESVKSILDSIPTSGMPYEEVLRTLDKIGIEWQVTEEGDLLVRCWQVGAEGFVYREEAAVIRSSRPSPKQGEELDWLSRNLQEVRERYGGQWVAISGNEIAAAAPNLPDLMSQITELDRPFITFIPSGPVIWTFTYANKGL